MSKKRTSTTANISPINNRMAETTTSRSKLLKDISEFRVPTEISSDPRVPEYAKTMIAQMTQMLQSVAALLVEQPTQMEVLEEYRRQHSVVVMGLPESNATTATARCKADLAAVNNILDAADIEVLPNAVYRMGQRGTRPRLVKIELPTRRAARDLIKSREKYRVAYPDLSIRESLSEQQRTQRNALIDECKKKREDTGQDYIIYAGQIILRGNIQNNRGPNQRK
jgi:hypothetical protein